MDGKGAFTVTEQPGDQVPDPGRAASSSGVQKE